MSANPFVQFATADGIVSIYTFCVSHCAGANSRGHLMLRTRDVIFSAGERVCPHLVVGGAGCSPGDAMCLVCVRFLSSRIYIRLTKEETPRVCAF
jgi:hypothetical protein